MTANDEKKKARSLNNDLWKEDPAFFRRAFAYRMIYTLLPTTLSRFLPRMLRRILLAPGVSLPLGVDPENPQLAGYVALPGTEFPPGWTPDQIPAAGSLIPPVLPPATTPPVVVEPGEGIPTEPGPVAPILPGPGLPPGYGIPTEPVPVPEIILEDDESPVPGLLIPPILPIEIQETGPTPPQYTAIYEPGPRDIPIQRTSYPSGGIDLLEEWNAAGPFTYTFQDFPQILGGDLGTWMVNLWCSEVGQDFIEVEAGAIVNDSTSASGHNDIYIMDTETLLLRNATHIQIKHNYINSSGGAVHIKFHTGTPSPSRLIWDAVLNSTSILTVEEVDIDVDLSGYDNLSFTLECTDGRQEAFDYVRFT